MTQRSDKGCWLLGSCSEHCPTLFSSLLSLEADCPCPVNPSLPGSVGGLGALTLSCMANSCLSSYLSSTPQALREAF